MIGALGLRVVITPVGTAPMNDFERLLAGVVTL